MNLEPKPEAVFLSPRVIDRRTFEEFGAVLRDLVRDAAVQRDALAAALKQAEALDSKAGLGAKALQQSLERAAKIYPLVDQRLTRLEQLLATPPDLLAEHRAKALDQARVDLRQSLDRIVQEELAATERRFRESIARRLEEQASAAARAATEQALQSATDAAARLDVLVSDGEARLTELIDTAQRQADAAQAAQLHTLETHESRLNARAEAADRDLADRTAAAQAAGRLLESRLTEARDAIARAGALNLDAMDAALAKVERRASALGDLDALAGMLEQGEAIAQDARMAVRQLESVAAQAEQARTILGEELLRGAAQVDALEARVRAAQVHIDTAAAKAAQLPDKVAVQSAAEAQARALAEHLKQMGQWLSGIIAAAQETGASLRQQTEPPARRLGA